MRSQLIAALFYQPFSAAENIAIAVLTVEIDKEYPIHDRIMLSMLDPFTTLGYKRKVYLHRSNVSYNLWLLSTTSEPPAKI